MTFFCGGSRNVPAFIHLFVGVFVLDVDEDILLRRLDARAPDEFGVTPDQRELVLRLHRTKADLPDGIIIDASQPLTQVVDEILRLTQRECE